MIEVIYNHINKNLHLLTTDNQQLGFYRDMLTKIYTKLNNIYNKKDYKIYHYGIYYYYYINKINHLLNSLIDYDIEAGQEELYNRAKDIYRIKKKFPDTYKDHMAYINNMKFINNQLSELPNVFGSSGSKAETYLKEIEPQVISYFDKLEKKRKEKAEGGRIGFDDGGPSQKDIDKGIAAIE